MALQISKDTNPFQMFSSWFDGAVEAGVVEPNAMSLASADKWGHVYNRIVLMKIYDEKGFCFFTNYESQKGQQLQQNPKAALCFHWRKPEHRQVRIIGAAEKMTYEESDDYFQSRPRGSRIAAWASPQSQIVEDRSALEQKLVDVEERFKDKEVPCPPNWGGFRLAPEVIEFWQEQEFRRHDRFRFSRTAAGEPWSLDRLAP